jgi:hypothetical protein
MDYKELKDGKYLLTLNIGKNKNIIDCITGKILYSHGKKYILTVNNGICSILDDFHKEAQVSYNFPLLEWFNVNKLY